MQRSTRTMTGVAQFFRPPAKPNVIEVPTVVLVSHAAQPIPTVRVEDLPQVDTQGKPIPTVRVEDLPRM